MRERFAREARLTAKVRHPGVVKVHGTDVEGDRPYLVLEFVAGQTLRQRLQDGQLPVVEAARLVAATADVLEAAHREGVLHRDIKPDNVMVEPSGDVRVLDFGIARGLQDDAPITRTGEIVGTPEYMAPEQLLDGADAITERTDVHALGVLLHELLTGRSPFHGANVFQALKLVESLVPPPPSRERTDVPPALDQVVGRALEKAPADRLPSAAAFAAAVRAAVPAARIAPRARPSPWTWYFWLPLAAAALIATIGVVVLLQSAPGITPQPSDPVERGKEPLRQQLLDLAAAETLLHEGQWCQVCAIAERHHAQGSDALQPMAWQAFAFAHLAWPLAAGAPLWLAATDEAQRTRFFGDRSEPATPRGDLHEPWQKALAGQPFEVPAGDSPLHRRARLLQAHLKADPAALPQAHADADLADDALARLLAIRLLPAAQRADAFASYAQRLRLDCPEHWLALCVERHLRNDPAEGARAAEMAWLSGAGEAAVLLDAFLHVAPLPGETTWRPLAGRPLERLRARVAGGDAADAPAGVMMLALLDAMHGLDPDLRPLRTLPERLRATARPWCVATAGASAKHHLPLLLLAASLGAVPDYSVSPWRETAPALRQRLDEEAKHGR